MSEPDSNLPEEDLLEFLGGIDEVNEDSRDGDFSGFLASEDVGRADRATTPAEDDDSE
jgi:hypothetical protein